MNKHNHFNASRRLAIKALAGAPAAALLTGAPSLAGVVTPGERRAVLNSGINCKLICREDNSRAYLLMSNPTDHEIAVARFLPDTIRFDDTTMNMADAYVEPVLIPARDRVMVRLNVKAIHGNASTSDIGMDAYTEFLPQGTRVVSLQIGIERGVAAIAMENVLT
jgi:hypothetical protein